MIRDDRLTGAILLGDNPAVGTVIQLFDRGAPVPADRRSLLLGRALGAAPARAGRVPGADAGRGHGLPVQHGHARARWCAAGAPAPGRSTDRRCARPGPAPAAAAAGTRSSGIVDWLATADDDGWR